MPWVRLDDNMPDHPKMAALTNAGLGCLVRCLCYCSRHLTDGVIPQGWAKRWVPPAQLRELEAAGVLMHEGDAYRIHDYLDYQPSRADVLANREQARLRMEVGRDKDLREFLRRRDGDRCRYCGCGVRWTDRRSSAGATYDHVDPEGGSGPENLVIACRGCNSAKGRRTPLQAGLVLYPPGYHLNPTQVVSKSDLSLFKTPVPDPDPDPVEDQKRPPLPPASGGRGARRTPPAWTTTGQPAEAPYVAPALHKRGGTP